MAPCSAARSESFRLGRQYLFEGILFLLILENQIDDLSLDFTDIPGAAGICCDHNHYILIQVPDIHGAESEVTRFARNDNDFINNN